MSADRDESHDLVVLAAAGAMLRKRHEHGSADREITVGALRGELPEETRRAMSMDDLYGSVGRLVERGHLIATVV